MQLKTYSHSEHHIDCQSIDPDALDVIFRLQEAGFIAYLVGGGVRDLLARRIPKDYDVSTSARPEQIKAIFGKRCLLIGKRFRLAHIRYGQKIFEVSTFRSGDTDDTDLIVRDNRWGTPEEDALRRDFTINGLFYDPKDNIVIDYVGGYDDIHKQTLRSIGNSIARFKQDPVRMIRLLKFRARFDFHIEEETFAALKQCLREIVKSSPARVVEEIFRMLESGSSARFFKLMSETGMLHVLFPCLDNFMSGPHSELAYSYLQALDQEQQARISRPLDRAIALAALTYPIVEQEIETLSSRRGHLPHIGQIGELVYHILYGIEISSACQFPKKILSVTASILVGQYRLTPLKHRPKFHSKALFSYEFGLLLNFLKIRTLVNSDLCENYLEWHNAYKTRKKPDKAVAIHTEQQDLEPKDNLVEGD